MVDLYFRVGVNPKESLLYTFGAPRSMSIDGVNYLHDKVSGLFRVTHHKDPVPHLPPCMMRCPPGTSWICLKFVTDACYNINDFMHHTGAEYYFEGSGDKGRK